MFSESPIKRRKSTRINVGNVPIGDGAPIAVQSMTNTNTLDIDATVAQIQAIQDAGADIVRVSVPTMQAAEAFKSIKEQVTIPLVTDIHFDYRIALKVAQYGADCLRINPGNIGSEERIRAVVDSAREHNIPIRIGVNGGSLERDLQEKYGEPTPEALLESAMRHVEQLEELFVGKKPIRFNRHTDKLFIEMDWSTDVLVNEYIIIECYRQLDPDTYTDVYSDWWFQRYATALIKRQWGENLKKFEGMQMPGGMQFNGQKIWEESIEEIRNLEEQMITSYSLPVSDMTG